MPVISGPQACPLQPHPSAGSLWPHCMQSSALKIFASRLKTLLLLPGTFVFLFTCLTLSCHSGLNSVVSSSGNFPRLPRLAQIPPKGSQRPLSVPHWAPITLPALSPSQAPPASTPQVLAVWAQLSIPAECGFHGTEAGTLSVTTVSPASPRTRSGLEYLNPLCSCVSSSQTPHFSASVSHLQNG